MCISCTVLVCNEATVVLMLACVFYFYDTVRIAAPECSTERRNDRCVVSTLCVEPVEAFVNTMVCRTVRCCCCCCWCGAPAWSAARMQLTIDGHELQRFSLHNPLRLSGLVMEWCCSEDADTVVDGSSLEVQDLPGTITALCVMLSLPSPALWRLQQYVSSLYVCTRTSWPHVGFILHHLLMRKISLQMSSYNQQVIYPHFMKWEGAIWSGSCYTSLSVSHIPFQIKPGDAIYKGITSLITSW